MERKGNGAPFGVISESISKETYLVNAYACVIRGVRVIASHVVLVPETCVHCCLCCCSVDDASSVMVNDSNSNSNPIVMSCECESNFADYFKFILHEQGSLGYYLELLYDELLL